MKGGGGTHSHAEICSLQYLHREQYAWDSLSTMPCSPHNIIWAPVWLIRIVSMVISMVILCPPTGTPGATPYGGCYLHFNQVEANMVLR